MLPSLKTQQDNEKVLFLSRRHRPRRHRQPPRPCSTCPRRGPGSWRPRWSDSCVRAPLSPLAWTGCWAPFASRDAIMYRFISYSEYSFACSLYTDVPAVSDEQLNYQFLICQAGPGLRGNPDGRTAHQYSWWASRKHQRRPRQGRVIPARSTAASTQAHRPRSHGPQVQHLDVLTVPNYSYY